MSKCGDDSGRAGSKSGLPPRKAASHGFAPLAEGSGAAFTRREVLGVAALPVLGQQAGQHAHTPEAAGTYAPKTFTGEELALIRDLAETILPRTDTPGAADAKVHHYIDRVLGSRPTELAAFRKGLRRCKGKKDLAALLESLWRKKDPFFKQIKDLTVDGYYSSREGLATELGWHGYTPLPEFHGCTHPEHKG